MMLTFVVLTAIAWNAMKSGTDIHGLQRMTPIAIPFGTNFGTDICVFQIVNPVDFSELANAQISFYFYPTLIHIPWFCLFFHFFQISLFLQFTVKDSLLERGDCNCIGTQSMYSWRYSILSTSYSRILMFIDLLETWHFNHRDSILQALQSYYNQWAITIKAIELR